MSDVIGRGVIEVSADSSKLNAAIAQARTRLKGLGEAGKDSTKNASASIDRYIRNLETQNATLGKSKREIELYRLALKGASDAQLKAANTALAARDAWDKNQEALKKAADNAERHKERMKTAFLTIAAAAAAMTVAGVHYFNEFVTQAADFQDMAEKTGESAENLASLFVSAKVGGLEMTAVSDAIVKLNNNLSGVDDESKAAGAALAALGLNIKDLKAMSGAEQLEAIGKAFNSFEDSSAKATVATALFSKSGKEMLSFLKELGNEGGRQKILTQEQIEQADDYADKLAKVRAQLSLQASALAVKLIPEITKFTNYLADLAKNEDAVAAVTATMKGALSGAVMVFQTFAVIGSDVAFTVRTIAREMDGLKRQAAALQRLDFKAIRDIGKEVADAAAADRARLDQFQRGVMALNKPAQPPLPSDKPKPKPDEKPKPEPQEPPKKTLKYTPPAASEKANAAKATADRKAQTDLDIEIIRQASEKTLNTYQNAERVLQARRQSNLVSETEYYESKAALIRLDADEQARALTAEIARMEQEKLTGKERLANERKIAEARGKLSKVRENEAIALDLTASDQAASVGKITQAYLDAAAAAQEYIDTIKRQNARIVEGAGRGQKFRDRQEGINAIEDKLLTRKNELDSDLRRKDITNEQYAAYLQVAEATYSEEIRLYDERTNAIEQKNADALTGMTEALHNYADETQDIAGMTEHAFTNALSGIEDAFVTLATTGKLTFKDLVQSIHADLVRIGFRSLIGKGVDALLNNSGLSSSLGNVFGSAANAAGGTKSAASVLNGATSVFGSAGELSGQAAQTAALTASTTALTAQTASVSASTAGITSLASAAGAAAAALASVGTSGAAGLASGGALGATTAVGGAASAASESAQATAQAASSAALAAQTAAITAATAATTAAATSAAALAAAETAAASVIATASATNVAALGGLGAAATAAAAALASVAASSGAKSGADFLAVAAAAGSRAIGGPVSSGGLYRVNERGPELLTVAGKEYLMLGQHGGDVSPTPTAARGGGNTYLNVTVAPPAGSSRATAMQFGATAGRQMQLAMRRNG
jgi:lambda family phage tail tape measure protein